LSRAIACQAYKKGMWMMDKADSESERTDSAELERSLGWYAAAVGITTGIFGALLAIGLALLPTTTLGEKALIIGAALALSAAGLAGVGAWRSARRFTATAIAAGLAILFLASLSVAAGNNAGTQQIQDGARSLEASASGKHAQSTSSTIPAAVASHPASTQSPTAQPSPSGRPVYLSDLTGTVNSLYPSPESGKWSITGTAYDHSLGYPDLCASSTGGPISLSVTYTISGSYRYFTAEVGVADGAAPDDQNQQVTFEVDGPDDGGSSNELGSKSAQYGRPTTIKLPIHGITQLTLTTGQTSGCISSTVIWGDARLVP
jgi:hypothetical protein